MNESVDLGGLSCNLNIPMSWIVSDNAFGASTALHFNNQNRLRMILGINETGHDVGEDSQELGQEIQRVDFKLNVILEMVGQLVRQNIVLPDVYSATIGPCGMLVSSAEPAPVGKQVLMKIYLDQRFPFSIDIAAEVVSSEAVEGGYQSSFYYLDLDETCQELLEKFIFRQHRRQIARMRHSAP